jgi:glycosyltransferase involved in cell wall biosynthesis
MPAVMNALDCLVHPQIATDAFPTVILEAMACAKPVVATRIDGALEQVVNGETGILLPPEDVPALSDAMANTMTRPALSRQWGARGRERVCNNFSLPVLAHKTLALYRLILGMPASVKPVREVPCFRSTTQAANHGE